MVQSCWVVFFVVFLHLPSWTQLCESFFLVCNMFQHQLCNSKYTSSNIDTSQNTAINMFDKGTKQPLSKAKNEVRSINMFNFQGGWGLHIVFIYKSNISYDDYIYICWSLKPTFRRFQEAAAQSALSALFRTLVTRLSSRSSEWRNHRGGEKLTLPFSIHPHRIHGLLTYI